MLGGQVARAQPQADVAVLHDTGPKLAPGLVAALDAALAQALDEIAGIRNPFVSPVGYGDVQLSVGCSDESAQCLTAIAQTAEVDAVIVRRLAVDETGTVRLRLLYFEESSHAPPSHAELAASAAEAEQLSQAIPDLVRRLLGIEAGSTSWRASSAGASSASAQTNPQDEAAGVTPWAWVSLAGGGALLASGIVLALSADADYDALQETHLSTPEDVDRAHRDFDSIETRATWSKVLIPAGVVALGAGATLLAIDLAASDSAEERSRARLSLAPLADGALLRVHGSLDGAR